MKKHVLYEHSVQSPNWQVDYLPQFHQWLIGKNPVSLREDFCGTGRISCEWVKRSKKNKALGIDLDPEVLHYANTVNKTSLSKDEQSRVRFLKQNVLTPTKEKFDFIGAYNFSYYIFHERKELLRYFKAAYKSLKNKGTLFLETIGGQDFLEAGSETTTFQAPGFGSVKKTWEQHQYDPITSVCDYSIHFKLSDGTILNDAFTYHWRIWQIREVRELLLEAGFKKTIVLWENPENPDEYLPTENAEPLNSWLAYVVGIKK